MPLENPSGIIGGVDQMVAWIAFSPTPTSSPGGAFTAASSSGKYKVIGKTVVFTITITITTVGGASGNIVIATPTGVPVRAAIAACKEVSLSGMFGGGLINTDSTIQIGRYDGVTMIGAGANIICTGLYEIA